MKDKKKKRAIIMALIICGLIIIFGIILAVGILERNDAKLNNNPKSSEVLKNKNELDEEAKNYLVMENEFKIMLETNDDNVITNVYQLKDDDNVFSKDLLINLKLDEGINKIIAIVKDKNYLENKPDINLFYYEKSNLAKNIKVVEDILANNDIKYTEKEISKELETEINNKIKEIETAEENQENKEQEVENKELETVAVTSVKITGDTEVEVNKTITLSVAIEPSDVADQKVTWKSSSSKVATVDENGVVTGKKLGSTTITATASNGIKGTLKIKVKNATTSNSTTDNNQSGTKQPENTTPEKTPTSDNPTCEEKLSHGVVPTYLNTFLRYEYEDEVSSESKYGTVFTTTKHQTYAIFSDAGKCLYKTVTEKNTDKSQFNATIQDLEPEARELYNKYKSDIVEQLGFVNQYRAEVNVANINLDEQLSVMATIRALEIAYGKFSHTRPDGRDCFTIFDDYSYNAYAMGENIAYGSQQASGISEQWRNSALHYSNMINANFTRIGIGKVVINGTGYWVQIFAN